jgi:membrane-bound lytic murein transglycosylase B
VWPLAISLLCVYSSHANAKPHPKPHAKTQSKSAPKKAVVITPQRNYLERSEVQEFIRETSEQYTINAEHLTKWIGQAVYQASAVKAILPPPAGAQGKPIRNWSGYQARFIEPTRIQAGKRFMQNNSADLIRAEKTYGVPANIIAGIIGVETIYGRQMGNYRLLDALTTLAFDYPVEAAKRDRRPFFKQELVALFQLTEEQHLDIGELRGSFAGAVGLPQFMPSSWRSYAVDFDGDGKIDLRNSTADAIGSVANFLKQHGWKTGEPITQPVIEFTNFNANEVQAVIEKDIDPVTACEQLPKWGIKTSSPLTQPNTPLMCAVFPMEYANGSAEYWIGHPNFFVITRYNRSSFYAMVVNQLAEAIAN